jgi:protein-tyrosine phosphatase
MGAHSLPTSGVLETPLGEFAVNRARVDQAGSVLQLQDDLARWMLERGIEQWRPGELPIGWIDRLLRRGAVHVVSRDDEVIGSVTVVWEDPAIWGDQLEPAGYIHQLMVDRRFAGYDVGRSLLTWTERFIVVSGRHRVRLDCVRTNRALRSYYERAGYDLVGYKDFPNIERALETALYEKALDA